MEYPITINNEVIKITSNTELSVSDQEELYRYLNIYYEAKQKVDEITFNFDNAKEQLTKALSVLNEEKGFEKAKTKWYSCTFIKGKNETIEQVKVLNEKRVINYLRDLGVDESKIQEFYDTKSKVSNKRKDSIRFTE